MEKIKAVKTIEEMPIDKAVGLCLQVLKKPKEITQENWFHQVREDLKIGRKSFRIRELTLKENPVEDTKGYNNP